MVTDAPHRAERGEPPRSLKNQTVREEGPAVQAPRGIDAQNHASNCSAGVLTHFPAWFDGVRMWHSGRRISRSFGLPAPLKAHSPPKARRISKSWMRRGHVVGWTQRPRWDYRGVGIGFESVESKLPTDDLLAIGVGMLRKIEV